MGRQQLAHLGTLAGLWGRDHELAGDLAMHRDYAPPFLLQVDQPRHALRASAIK